MGSTAKNLLYDQLSLPEVGSEVGKEGRAGGQEERREGFLGRRDRHASVLTRGKRLIRSGAIFLCALSLMALFSSSPLSLPPFLPFSLLLSLPVFLSSSLRRKSPRWWLSAGVAPLARPNCCDSFSTLLTWGVDLVRRGEGGGEGGRREGGCQGEKMSSSDRRSRNMVKRQNLHLSSHHFPPSVFHPPLPPSFPPSLSPSGLAEEAPVVMHLILSTFETKRSIDEPMGVALWRQSAAYLHRLLTLLDAEPQKVRERVGEGRREGGRERK